MRYRLMASYRGVPYEAGLGPSDADVVLFAACPPPEELGFEPATGHWRKRLIRGEVDALWESRPVGVFRGEPCIVLDDLGERLHIAYVGRDANHASRLGYWQVDRGVFELLALREDVTDLTEERVERAPRETPGPATGPAMMAGDSADGGHTTPNRYPPAQEASTGRFPAPPDTIAAPYPPPGAETNALPDASTNPPPPLGPLEDLRQAASGTPQFGQASPANIPQGGPGFLGDPDRAAPGSPPAIPQPGPASPADGPLTAAFPTGVSLAGPSSPADLPLAGPSSPADIPLAGSSSPADLPLTGPSSPADLPLAGPGFLGDPRESAQTSPASAPGVTPAAPANGPAAAQTAPADAFAATPAAPRDTHPAAATSPANVPQPGAGGPGGTRGAPPARIGASPGSESPDGLKGAPSHVPLPGSSAPPRDHEPTGGPPEKQRRAARRKRVSTRDIFSGLTDLAAIPRAAYALEAEVDGTLCLLTTADGFEVFVAADGARHEVRSFSDEETAYFYLFGVLAAEAVRNGSLAPVRIIDGPQEAG